jgi:hypothetical protein
LTFRSWGFVGVRGIVRESVPQNVVPLSWLENSGTATVGVDCGRLWSVVVDCGCSLFVSRDRDASQTVPHSTERQGSTLAAALDVRGCGLSVPESAIHNPGAARLVLADWLDMGWASDQQQKGKGAVEGKIGSPEQFENKKTQDPQ